jgi:hypothetical protein
MPWTPPRRATSTATTVTVNSSATALKTAAAATGSGTFNEFIQTTFWTRYAHPLTGSYPAGNFYDANVGEDAANSTGHTHIDYGGKWCYDPVRRKGMFLANGANPVGSTIRIYSHVWNTLALYDEASNTWSTQRAVKCPDEGADPDCIVHILHNNTIDATNGILYKKKFRGADRIMRYDIANNTFLNTIPTAVGIEPDNYAHDGAMEWIPTRGTGGALWLFCVDRNNDRPRLAEYNIATGVWSVIVNSPAFGTGTTTATYCMSYNPRAFGGAGGVLCGSANGPYTVRCDTLAVASAGTPPQAMVPANGLKLCADPVGDGWYYSSTTTGYLYRCNGSTWTQVVQLPSDLATPGNTYPSVLCPIHREGASDYGVIWILGGQMPSRGATNGMGSWLFKP